MVAEKVNQDVSFFLSLMYSPLIGDKNIINGHAIYNALLCWKHISPNDIDKVSFGIPQNNPISLKGSNVFKLNTSEEPKRNDLKWKKKPSDTVLDNLKKGYSSFVVLRSTENILTNPLIDYSPIPFSIVRTQKGQKFLAHEIDYFTFFVVWKNKRPNIDFTNTEFNIGIGRNNGFGLTNIERVYDTTINDLVVGVPESDKFTAINGIKGIYNHSRYGFGEYILDTMNTGKKIIKLTTPLCINSTYPKTTQYGTLPEFVKQVSYIKSPYSLWDKGIEHTLQVIRPGKAFEISEGDTKCEAQYYTI